jgi:hypothetical protein
LPIQGRQYIADTRLSVRYSEYIRQGKSCDMISDTWGKNIPRESDWASLARQKAKLEE